MENLKRLYQKEFDYRETLKVLKSPPNVYWSWGVSNITQIGNVGLLLKVNGHHHKDYVLITLGYLDLYIVTLLDKDRKILKVIENLYFDMLQDAIDKEIEFINSYKQ